MASTGTKVTNLFQRLVDGEDFETIAEELASDPSVCALFGRVIADAEAAHRSAGRRVVRRALQQPRMAVSRPLFGRHGSKHHCGTPK